MRKLSEILEIGMTRYDPMKEGQPGGSYYCYMCNVLQYCCPELRKVEVDFAHYQIDKKIDGKGTLSGYMISKNIIESFVGPGIVELKIKFYKDWIEELKKQGN